MKGSKTYVKKMNISYCVKLIISEVKCFGATWKFVQSYDRADTIAFSVSMKELTWSVEKSREVSKG